MVKNLYNTEISRTPDVPTKSVANPPVLARETTLTTGTAFQINNAKPYVPVGILTISDIKFLKHLKQGFRRTVYWNEYRSEIKTESKTNKLHCMIDPTFRIINRQFCYFIQKW